MSLTIACYIPTAIILSGESRSTSTYTNSIVDESDIEYTMTYIASDFENKVFLALNKFNFIFFSLDLGCYIGNIFFICLAI